MIDSTILSLIITSIVTTITAIISLCSHFKRFKCLCCSFTKDSESTVTTESTSYDTIN